MACLYPVPITRLKIKKIALTSPCSNIRISADTNERDGDKSPSCLLVFGTLSNDSPFLADAMSYTERRCDIAISSLSPSCIASCSTEPFDVFITEVDPYPWRSGSFSVSDSGSEGAVGVAVICRLYVPKQLMILSVCH